MKNSWPCYYFRNKPKGLKIVSFKLICINILLLIYIESKEPGGGKALRNQHSYITDEEISLY